MIESVPPAGLTLSVVDDSATFAEMADEWRVLANQSSACFFMSWEWHYTWWQVYSTPKHRLYLLRVSDGDKLVGVLPLYSCRQGLALRHTLLFTGTGEARADEVTTEYLDVIAHPDYQKQVCDVVLDWISGCAGWDRVELRFLLDDALLVKAYRERGDLSIIERDVGNRYRVDLASSETAHLEKLSKSRAKRIGRSQRALEKEGGLTQSSVSSADELNQAFALLAELNHERQATKSRKSVFASEKFNLFHRQLVAQVFANGSVNIHQFKLKNSLLAVIYCFYDEQTCYYYQSGFSRRESNKYMPLTFAHFAEIKCNREAGLAYYDLMRAEPPTYKEDFGCETTPMITSFIFCTPSRLWWFNARKAIRRKLVASLKALGIERS